MTATPPTLQDWCRDFQAACDAIPFGRLHQRLSAPWLEQQIQLHPGAPGPEVLAALRPELQRICTQAALGLRLHAAFRGAGHASAISAELMLDLQRLLNEELGGPLNRMLVDRIYAEFKCAGPDWSKVAGSPALSEPLLAMALQHSRHTRPKPPVRFAIDLLNERNAPTHSRPRPGAGPHGGS